MQHSKSVGIFAVYGIEHSVRVGQVFVMMVAMMVIVMQVFLPLRTVILDAVRRAFVHLPHRFLLIILKAFLSSQVAAVLEHVARVRVERPERALAGLVRRSRNFHEAVVEAE